MNDLYRPTVLRCDDHRPFTTIDPDQAPRVPSDPQPRAGIRNRQESSLSISFQQKPDTCVQGPHLGTEGIKISCNDQVGAIAILAAILITVLTTGIRYDPIQDTH